MSEMVLSVKALPETLLLKQATHGSVRLYMNRVNLYEVYYGFYREY